MSNTPIDDNDIFTTRDLVLATYLKINSIKLAGGYDKLSKSWSFYDPATCEELSLELRNGNSKVEVLKYESERRSLLGMVHDKKNQ